jgi:hypothetical protein
MRPTACILIYLALVLAGCGNEEQRARDDLAKAEAANVDVTPEPPPVRMIPDLQQPPPVKPAPVAMPEPTTPAEIDVARKQAMVDGRDRDVIKYCEMSKVDVDKTDPQVLLGCALASCRIGEVDKARMWSKTLPKPLKDQAIKICLANQVPL